MESQDHKDREGPDSPLLDDDDEILHPRNRHLYSYSVANLLNKEQARHFRGTLASKKKICTKSFQGVSFDREVDGINIAPKPSRKIYHRRKELINLLKVEMNAEITEQTELLVQHQTLTDKGEAVKNVATEENAVENTAVNVDAKSDPQEDSSFQPLGGVPRDNNFKIGEEKDDLQPDTKEPLIREVATADAMHICEESRNTCHESFPGPFPQTQFLHHGYLGAKPLFKGPWAGAETMTGQEHDEEKGEGKDIENLGSRVPFLKAPPKSTKNQRDDNISKETKAGKVLKGEGVEEKMRSREVISGESK